MLLSAVLLTTCAPAPLSGILPVNAPQSIIAGDAVRVTVGPVRVSDGTNVGLVMISKHGPRVYQSAFEAGVAEFTIPGEHTRQVGYLTFIAAAQDARGETGLRLQPRSSGDRQQAAVPTFSGIFLDL